MNTRNTLLTIVALACIVQSGINGMDLDFPEVRPQLRPQEDRHHGMDAFVQYLEQACDHATDTPPAPRPSILYDIELINLLHNITATMSQCTFMITQYSDQEFNNETRLYNYNYTKKSKSIEEIFKNNTPEEQSNMKLMNESITQQVKTLLANTHLQKAKDRKELETLHGVLSYHYYLLELKTGNNEHAMHKSAAISYISSARELIARLRTRDEYVQGQMLTLLP